MLRGKILSHIRNPIMGWEEFFWPIKVPTSWDFTLVIWTTEVADEPKQPPHQRKLEFRKVSTNGRTRQLKRWRSSSSSVSSVWDVIQPTRLLMPCCQWNKQRNSDNGVDSVLERMKSVLIGSGHNRSFISSFPPCLIIFSPHSRKNFITDGKWRKNRELGDSELCDIIISAWAPSESHIIRLRHAPHMIWWPAALLFLSATHRKFTGLILQRYTSKINNKLINKGGKNHSKIYTIEVESWRSFIKSLSIRPRLFDRTIRLIINPKRLT